MICADINSAKRWILVSLMMFWLLVLTFLGFNWDILTFRIWKRHSWSLEDQLLNWIIHSKLAEKCVLHFIGVPNYARIHQWQIISWKHHQSSEYGKLHNSWLRKKANLETRLSHLASTGPWVGTPLLTTVTVSLHHAHHDISLTFKWHSWTLSNQSHYLPWSQPSGDQVSSQLMTVRRGAGRSNTMWIRKLHYFKDIKTELPDSLLWLVLRLKLVKTLHSLTLTRSETQSFKYDTNQLCHVDMVTRSHYGRNLDKKLKYITVRI